MEDAKSIDDPFGSMEDAKSPTIRDKVWDWYQGTVYNRLQPKGAIVLINHRMHEDDLSGRLIEQMKAGNDQWTIVELPAIALENDQLRRQKGEPLWPAQFPLEEFTHRLARSLIEREGKTPVSAFSRPRNVLLRVRPNGVAHGLLRSQSRQRECDRGFPQ
jgi:hypothetical protein